MKVNASMNSTDFEVRDYVGQVRAALADLPAEDVEEFTTGMEADLAERLAEPGDGTLRDRLGEPEAYAAELRSAAGLPPRAAVVQSKKPVAQRLSGLWSDLSSSVLTAMPWLRDLRPIWWFVRGFSLAVIPGLVLGTGIVWWGTLGAVFSIAAGLMSRHGRLTGGWVGPLRVIGNLAAVLLLPFAFVLLVDGRNSFENDQYYVDSQATYGPGGGLTNEGEPVANVYAYDESGRRIDKVRLLDQNGRPLKVSEDALLSADNMGEVEMLRDPRTGELDITRDVFPLRWNGRSGWERMYDREWEAPMAITPLPGPVPTIEPSDPATTPTPGATASPSPSAPPTAPQTSPSSGVSATPTPAPSASPSASR